MVDEDLPGTPGPIRATGKFILLPGVELTQKLGDLHVHLNYINLPRVLPCIQDAQLIKKVHPPQTVGGLLTLNAAEAAQAAAGMRRPYVLMLNHPFWRCLILCPRICWNARPSSFEICNSGADFAPDPAAGVTPDKFWDAVNAFRCAAGRICCTASGRMTRIITMRRASMGRMAWAMPG